MVEKYIGALVDYGIRNGLIEKEDSIYIINRLLEACGLYFYSDNLELPKDLELPIILENLSNNAVSKGIIADSQNSRDRYSDGLMDIITPRPSEIIKKFYEKYDNSPLHAAEYFYSLCEASDYIKTYRIKKDIKWTVMTEYGELKITINLSKPEKDPKDIEMALKAVGDEKYPKCLICFENEGYSGNSNHPSRQNLRIIPIKLNRENWGFQYSPYLYYNRHCIIIGEKHNPMRVDKRTIALLVDFLKLFPHYFIGSNAGLPVVGGSILSHEHFQGGEDSFPLDNAPIKRKIHVDRFPNVEVGILNWSITVIRAKTDDEKELIEFSDYVMTKWQEFNAPEVGIFSQTGNTPHNAVTPILRIRDKVYEIDLALRNNITTSQHPMGVFHPHKELHNIKKENIGLIEVMGLAILPPRLLGEMEIIKNSLLGNADLKTVGGISHHVDWVESWRKNYEINKENIDEILKKEIGISFSKCLECVGVFKDNEDGQKALECFIKTL